MLVLNYSCAQARTLRADGRSQRLVTYLVQLIVDPLHSQAFQADMTPGHPCVCFLVHHLFRNCPMCMARLVEGLGGYYRGLARRPGPLGGNTHAQDLYIRLAPGLASLSLENFWRWRWRRRECEPMRWWPRVEWWKCTSNGQRGHLAGRRKTMHHLKLRWSIGDCRFSALLNNVSRLRSPRDGIKPVYGMG